MARERLNDPQLLRSSELFDEEFYLASYPEVARSGMEPVKHYLRVGALLGFDPCPEFSSRAYLEANPDVAERRMNPLVHYLRMGRLEKRKLNPLAELKELIEDSGFFDDDYYRHFHPEIPNGVDAAYHFLIHGNHDLADPSEAFNTGDYLRTYPDVAAGTQNALVHYLRHGRREKRTITPGRPRYPLLSDLWTTQHAGLAALSTTAMPGEDPRVTVVLEEPVGAELGAAAGITLALGLATAGEARATLRLVTRSGGVDASAVGVVRAAYGLEFEGQVEVDELAAGRSLPVRSSDLVVVSDWRTTRAALAGAIRPRSLVWVLDADPRASLTGEERRWCAETLAGEEGTLVVVSEGLYRELLDDGAIGQGRDVVVLEPGSFTPAQQPAATDPDAQVRRRLVVWGDPTHPGDRFWDGMQGVADAVEAGWLDPDWWTVTVVGRHTPDFSLPRGLRPEFVREAAIGGRAQAIPPVDVGVVLREAGVGSYPILDLVLARVPVLALAAPASVGDVDKEGLLVCGPTPEQIAHGVRDMLARTTGGWRTSPLEWSDSLRPVAARLVAERLPRREAD